jgi:putative endonuclease
MQDFKGLQRPLRVQVDARRLWVVPRYTLSSSSSGLTRGSRAKHPWAFRQDMGLRVKPEDDDGGSGARRWITQDLTRGSKTKQISRMTGYVYIVTNHKHGTLYIGVTSDLERRIYEHREAATPGFASKYGCRQLVWYEEHFDIADAIQREKSLKRWYRKWKIDLVESFNPDWRDLYFELW